MTVTTETRAAALPDLDAASADRRGPRRTDKRMPLAIGSTAVLLLGALYCLLPVAWVVIASTKDASELFSTFTFAPSAHLWDNIVELTNYRDGLYWRWMLNTALYAGVGAIVSAYVSALSGYALAKYTFPGKGVVFKVLLMGVLVPGVILAIPQYLLLAQVGLTNTYWSVLLPQLISPYGIYLARIYAAAAVPTDIVESARTEGARELYIFHRIALPMMGPGPRDDLPVPVRRRLEQLHAAVHHARQRRAVPAHRRALGAAEPGCEPARHVHARHHRRAAVDRAAHRVVPRVAALLARRPRGRSREGVTPHTLAT